MQTVPVAKSQTTHAARKFRPHLPFEKSLPLLEVYRDTVSQLICSNMRLLCNLLRKVRLLYSIEKQLIPSPNTINCSAPPTACRLLVPALRLPALEISLMSQDLTLFGMIVEEDQPLEQARAVLELAVCAANDRALAVLHASVKPDFNSLEPLVLELDFGAEAMRLFSMALHGSTSIRVLDRETRLVAPSGLGVSLKVREVKSLESGYTPQTQA